MTGQCGITIEHLDERLDKWWEQSIPGKRRYFDRNIGPIGELGNISYAERDILRHYDLSTRKLIFWGDELDIDEFLVEVNRLRNQTIKALKPLWEQVPEGHTEQ
jgi:hypothetical protein